MVKAAQAKVRITQRYGDWRIAGSEVVIDFLSVRQLTKGEGAGCSESLL
jgi:hypothetical protein